MTVTQSFVYNQFLQQSNTLGGTTSFQENHVHLSFGYPFSSLFPLQNLAEVAYKETLASPNALHYFGGDGTQGIRNWLVERLRNFSIETTVKNIVITAGAAQAIEIMARIFVNVGDEIWVENPSFFGALRSFKLAGASIRAFDLEEDGINVDQLEAELHKRTANGESLPKCLYVMPNYQNPTAITMSIEKRQRLAALATEFNFYILEDDAYAELKYEGEYLPAIQTYNTERVVYIGTFSKFIGPGIRLGWAVLPDHLRSYVQQFLHGSQTNPYMQQVIAKFLTSMEFDEYVSSLRHFYIKQRDVMLNALQQQFGHAITCDVPKGGFFLSVYFNNEIDATALAKRAESLGVSVVDGSAFYEDGHHQMIRLCFTYCTAAQIELGIARLKQAYDDLTS